jgi:hypothetical protein
MALNPPLQLKFFDGWGSSTDSPKGTSSKVHRLRDTTPRVGSQGLSPAIERASS